ncbi:MAG TPA: DUF3375 domain-containing protein, partial [Telluria sp.]|nr:DUF3375 domain-containing protein [Telluria sp.]
QFIGTESRLMTVFDLLRQIVDGTELNPRTRIAELQKRKAEIDAEIQQIQAGRLDMMDPTQIRERFLQMAGTARELLSDFRAVDQNLRSLDRAVRERIATWEGRKGELLQDMFGRRDVIADTDEGKSFRAFWDLLMSPSRQDELTALLNTVLKLDPVRSLEPDGRLRRIHYDWLEAGEVTQRTVARLSEQLRRYLDDQAWLENRRIMQLIRDIEQKALAVRGTIDTGPFIELDEAAPSVGLPMDRTLYSPPFKPRITQQIVDEQGAPVPADALYEQVYVDRLRLMSNVRRALQTRKQITLGALLEEYPLEQGLAELATYLSLATQELAGTIDDVEQQTVSWIDARGARRQATLPLLVFSA